MNDKLMVAVELASMVAETFMAAVFLLGGIIIVMALVDVGYWSKFFLGIPIITSLVGAYLGILVFGDDDDEEY
jgi:hypothetical protein